MRITTHNLNSAIENRLRTPALVIIEFTLSELPARGGPGQLLELSLAANYMPNPKDLHYEQIHFDIKDNAAFKAHTASVARMVARLRTM